MKDACPANTREKVFSVSGVLANTRSRWLVADPKTIGSSAAVWPHCRLQKYKIRLMIASAKEDFVNDNQQLAILGRAAAWWLSADAAIIQKFIDEGELVEVQK